MLLVFGYGSNYGGVELVEVRCGLKVLRREVVGLVERVFVGGSLGFM